MKTKILSLVLAAIMVISSLSLVSCKKEKTPYETVAEAIENTLALDTVKVVLDENSKQKVDGSTQTQKTNITSVFKGFNTEAPEYSTDLSIKTSGVTVEMGLYYKDGYFYLDALGSKTKVKEGNETDSYNVYDLVKSVFRTIPEEQFGEKTLEEGKIEFELTPEVFEANFKEYIDRSVASVEAIGKINTKTFDNCKVEIEVKDGYVVSYSVSYDLKLKVKIQTQIFNIEVQVTDDLKIVDPGKEVTVSVPSDLDEYDG